MKVAATPLKVSQSLDENRYLGIGDADLEPDPTRLKVF
jgi:hypothetical protein